MRERNKIEIEIQDVEAALGLLKEMSKLLSVSIEETRHM